MRVLLEVINNLSYKDVICPDTSFINLEGKSENHGKKTEQPCQWKTIKKIVLRM